MMDDGMRRDTVLVIRWRSSPRDSIEHDEPNAPVEKSGRSALKKERLDDDFVKEACAQGSLNAQFDEEGDSADADVCWLAGWVPGTSRFS